MYINKFSVLLLLVLFIYRPVIVGANQLDSYDAYLKRLGKIQTEQDIVKNGFTILEDQQFQVQFENLGLVNFIAAIDEKYGRMVLFFSDSTGHIVYKTDQLESNNWNRGEMKQPNRGIAAVAFRDMDNNGLKDIVIICTCMNEAGTYVEKPYKVGDVLFQNANGFYKDWRLSDRINRFSMNKSVEIITAFVRDGQSAEFLYTSNTMEMLLKNGFKITENQSFTIDFEKFGEVQVVPGTYNMAGHYIFMIFLVNSDGRIVWNFQPMEDYDNFHELKGISFKDIDGDGLKDVIILAQYKKLLETGQTIVEDSFSIYYQRAGYFYEDDKFKKAFIYTGEETLNTIIQKAQEFWGWGTGK